MASTLGTFSGGGIGYGMAFTLVDNFSNTSRKIERQMASLGASANAMAASVEASLARARVGAGLFLGSLVSLSFFVKSAKIDAEFQNYELAFRSFLGSAEEAHKLFEQVKAEAIANPKFSIEAMEKATLMLVSQGNAADHSLKTVKALSTVLLGVGGGNAELQRTAVALEKVKAAGMLTGRQLLSFDAARVPIVKMLEASLGQKIDRTKISKYGITFEQVADAIYKATQAGGQFGNVMQMLEGNVSAKAAQIRENFMAAMGDIGHAIRPVTLAVLKVVGAFTDWVRAMAATEGGKMFFRVWLGATLLIGALGLLMLIMAANRLMLYSMAGAFSMATKTQVMHAMATRGTAAAYGVLGRAFLTTMWPIIAIGGLAFLTFTSLTSVSEDMLSTWGGFLGGVGQGVKDFFSDLANNIKVVTGVWNTWNGTTATLNGFDKLTAFQEKLVTWTVKFKEFFAGLGFGFLWFTNVWLDAANIAFEVMYKIYEVARWVLSGFGIELDNNAAALDRWRFAGMLAGTILSAALFRSAMMFLFVGKSSLWAGIVGMGRWIMSLKLANGLTLIQWIRNGWLAVSNFLVSGSFGTAAATGGLYTTVLNGMGMAMMRVILIAGALAAALMLGITLWQAYNGASSGAVGFGGTTNSGGGGWGNFANDDEKVNYVADRRGKYEGILNSADSNYSGLDSAQKVKVRGIWAEQDRQNSLQSPKQNRAPITPNAPAGSQGILEKYGLPTNGQNAGGNTTVKEVTKLIAPIHLNGREIALQIIDILKEEAATSYNA